jgi:hypothetical protein
MANDGKIYVGDIGTVILIDMKENLDEATKFRFDVITPTSKVNPSTGEMHGGKQWDCEVVNSNFLQYITEEGDLSSSGVWKILPYVEFADWSGHGLQIEFIVHPLGE